MQCLSEMVQRMKADGLLVQYVPGDTEFFERLAFDSRAVGPDDCFVALRGTGVDGHLFIDKAVKNGAIAIVCEAVPADSEGGAVGTALVHVTNSRKALTSASSLLEGDPGQALHMVGITGTNGKTTTASLIRHVFEFDGIKTGFIGTTGYSDGDGQQTATHTTPSPVRLYQLLSAMREAGCGACSMEVSSHALDQYRVRIEDFNVGVFTNLTRDHLDYHRTEDAYLEAKKRLFDGLSRAATAVVNADDPAGKEMVRQTSATVITYGMDADSDVRYEVVDATVSGLRLILDGHDAHFQLAGRFNAANIAGAYGAGLASGITPSRVIEALMSAPPVAGRFEMIQADDNRTIIVDYAHTPDALENVLEAVRQITPSGSLLWCIFGCGGDRDTGKRPLMGQIAERLADRVIVTSDNPRTEDPKQIMDGVRNGFKSPQKVHWIIDRQEAIRMSADLSGPGDVVLIAGKGHELVQVLGTERVPFDDREEARIAFGTGTN